MKLGEALTVRRRQADKLNDLRNRIQANALAQEGDQPQEDAGRLIEAFVALSRDHADLIRCINWTNVQTVTQDGTLLDLITEKDDATRVRNVLQAAAEAATGSREAKAFSDYEANIKDLTAAAA